MIGGRGVCNIMVYGAEGQRDGTPLSRHDGDIGMKFGCDSGLLCEIRAFPRDPVGARRRVERRPEFFEIPSDDKPLQALMFRPAGDGPFPAIVAMHGCDGLTNSAGKLRRGYRGLGRASCGRGLRSAVSRTATARAVLTTMPRQRAAPCDRIASASPMHTPRATGCSSRISSRKDRISPARLGQWRHRRAVGGAAESCAKRRAGRIFARRRYSIRAAAGWARPPGARRIPTLILLGALDDWAPAKNCEQMVAGARGRSARAVIVKYKSAHHISIVRICRSAAAQCRFSAGRLRPRHGRQQSEARADALKRVPQWLAR